MAVIQGTVKWAGDQKKYGNYSFRLEEYDDEWFRSKQRHADVIQAGNVVKLQATKNKRDDFDVSKVKLVEAGSAPSSAPGNKGASDSGYASRQASIMMQHSQDVASRVAELLVTAGAVKLAKTKAEANKLILLDLIDELTGKYYAAANAPAEFVEGRPESEGLEDSPEEAEEEEFEEESGDDPEWD